MRLKIIVLLIVLLTISGCNSNKNNISEIKTLDKAPEGLVDINKEISKILKDNGNIERIGLDIEILDDGGESDKGDQQEEGSQSEEAPAGSTEESSQGGGENEAGGSKGASHGSSSHGSEDGSPEEKKQDMSEQIWSSMDKSLEELYYNLLSYENDAIKTGASTERIVQLKDSINKLVKGVEERNVVHIYDHGSQSLLFLKPFYDLYKDDYRGEISDLKHSIYQYYLKAISGNKEEAKNVLDGKDENINKIRLLIGEDDKKLKELDKISTSFDSIGISLDENSKRVLILEKDTLIKNLESLE